MWSYKCTESGSLQSPHPRNGWINSEGMKEWMKYRAQKTSAATWLIMDVFPAHLEASVLKRLRDYNITVFFIPPGLTSVCQVHDTHINRTFKDHMEIYQEKWRFHHPGVPSTRELLLEWSQSAIVDVGVNVLLQGFEQNVLAAITDISKEDAEAERPPPDEEGKDEATKKKETAKIRKEEKEARAHALENPAAQILPQVFPNDRKQRSHSKMTPQKVLVKSMEDVRFKCF
jgi:hypothetical protein